MQAHLQFVQTLHTIQLQKSLQGYPNFANLNTNFFVFHRKVFTNLTSIVAIRPTYNTRSTKMRGFGSLLTKFYLSKVVQRWTMKHGANPHYC